MKYLVDLLIEKWEKAAKLADINTNGRVVYLLTAYCLKCYRKYLTGGKQEE